MSEQKDFGGARKGEHPKLNKGEHPEHAHSYWVGPSRGMRKRGIPYRVEVLYERILKLITNACRADHAALIMSSYAYPYDEAGRIFIYPEPVSDEEKKLWKFVGAYIGKSVRLEVPLNVPGSLKDALNLGTMLVSPAFGHQEGASVVAVFTNSSSPPMDSEDENTLSRLAGKFTHIFRTAVSPKSKRFRSHKVSRVLRARNTLLSVSELCGTLDGLMELVVSLGLAESAYVRILDEDTGMLKLVASAGKQQIADTHSHVPASKCSIMCLAPKTRTPRYVKPYQCDSLSESTSPSAICKPFSTDLSNMGVLSLSNPPDEGLNPADRRIIRAVISTAEKAFLDTRMFDAAMNTWERAAFVEYASIAGRASDDVTQIARELLACLRRALNFQVGAFVNCQNGPEVFSVLFSSTEPLIVNSAEPEGNGTTGDFNASSALYYAFACIILGDPEAEEWVDKALKQLEPDMPHIYIRPFHMHESRWPACLAVPLVSGGNAIGYFIMGKPKGDRFSKEDIDYCESVRYDLMLLWENFVARIKPKTTPAVEAMLERIETLEQLAVGTAHEIKNPLAVIKGYMQVMQLDPGLSPEIRKRIDRLLRQVEQISGIADDLAGLAKLNAVDIAPNSLLKLLEEVLDTLESQVANTGISLVRSYPDSVPEDFVDAGKLQQAFLNICRNAIEMMSAKGGELRVTVRVSDDGRNVEIEFRDTGPGISREAMGMLFRPFFTTKRQGTGLGLNISMHIARLHGGTIRVENAKGGKGAIFTVVLPITNSRRPRFSR